jgi:hypothetical protein
MAYWGWITVAGAFRLRDLRLAGQEVEYNSHGLAMRMGAVEVRYKGRTVAFALTAESEDAGIRICVDAPLPKRELWRARLRERQV